MGSTFITVMIRTCTHRRSNLVSAILTRGISHQIFMMKSISHSFKYPQDLKPVTNCLQVKY